MEGERLMENIIEGIQRLCNNGRELLKEYEKIPMGFVGAGFIKVSIRNAEEAIASGDVVKMLSAYKDLEGLE
jgi:hypothetical protein